MPRLLLIAIPVAVTIYALFDAIMTPRNKVRTLPKWFWIVAIVVLWIGGAVLWFFLGRPRKKTAGGGSGGGSGDVGRGYRRPVGPDDDPDFLAEIDRRKPESDS